MAGHGWPADLLCVAGGCRAVMLPPEYILDEIPKVEYGVHSCSILQYINDTMANEYPLRSTVRADVDDVLSRKGLEPVNR